MTSMPAKLSVSMPTVRDPRALLVSPAGSSARPAGSLALEAATDMTPVDQNYELATLRSA
jgi:hypothetical protein